jgi:Ca-activated chloride channel family protein
MMLAIRWNQSTIGGGVSKRIRTAGIVAAAAAFGLPAVGAAPARGTQAVPRFGIDVEVVNLAVSVADSRRKHVTGLESADFTILEDGVRQQVTVFDQQDVPLSVSILIDSSLSMQPRMPVVQSAALRLVSALRPQDAARVVRFNQRHEVVQELTSDHALLEGAVRSIRPEGATGLYNALYVALRDAAGQTQTGEVRKRALVLLSDGADTTSLLSDDQVLEAARRAGVTVYAVGLGIANGSVVGDTNRARYFLTALASETGGEAFFPRELGELDGVYDRIARELSMQYSLGYVSSNAIRDGKWRRVVVHSARGAFVRHRAGYYAGKPGRTRAARPRPGDGVTSRVRLTSSR